MSPSIFGNQQPNMGSHSLETNWMMEAVGCHELNFEKCHKDPSDHSPSLESPTEYSLYDDGYLKHHGNALFPQLEPLLSFADADHPDLFNVYLDDFVGIDTLVCEESDNSTGDKDVEQGINDNHSNLASSYNFEKVTEERFVESECGPIDFVLSSEYMTAESPELSKEAVDCLLSGLKENLNLLPENLFVADILPFDDHPVDADIITENSPNNGVISNDIAYLDTSGSIPVEVLSLLKTLNPLPKSIDDVEVKSIADSDDSSFYSSENVFSEQTIDNSNSCEKFVFLANNADSDAVFSHEKYSNSSGCNIEQCTYLLLQDGDLGGNCNDENNISEEVKYDDTTCQKSDFIELNSHSFENKGEEVCFLSSVNLRLDDKASLRRMKNNAASKITRAKRRSRYKELFEKEGELLKRNAALRIKIEAMQKESNLLRELLIAKLSGVNK